MASKDAIQVIEPATAEVMAELPRAGAQEADEAVQRAKAAYPSWKKLSPADRSALLHRLADAIGQRQEDLAKLEARNAGKPIGDAGRDGDGGRDLPLLRGRPGAADRQ